MEAHITLSVELSASSYADDPSAEAMALAHALTDFLGDHTDGAVASVEKVRVYATEQELSA